MALSNYNSYLPNATIPRDRELLGKGLHIGPVNSAVGTANTLKSTVAWFAKVDNHRLDTVWPRIAQSNCVSLISERLQLRLFWLVVFGTDHKSAPILAKDVIGITLSTVIT
jgi:hypothetical protein